MEAAARLAARARPLARPNPGVGALVVKDNRVIARGWTQPGGRPHAEAIALEAAGRAARGATLFVTLEPCAHVSSRGPACADLVAEAGLERVVVGQLDPDPRTAGKGLARIARSGTAADVLHDETSASSLAGHFTRSLRSRPHVTLKLALSLDGCIALSDGTSRWITGEAARAHVHAQRARHDAILVGGGTWRADRPRLDVRLPGLGQRSPTRILLTRGVAPDGVRVINRPDQIAELDDVNYLYIEGGRGTSASFLGEDLVDELHIYRAPIIIGDGLRAIGDFALADLESAHERWREGRTVRLGSDRFTTYCRIRDKETV